jgi:hypothetical protein
MDVAALQAPPRRGISAEAWLASCAAGVAVLTLLLQSAVEGGTTTRPPIFEYLFKRNEVAAAWLNLALLLIAWTSLRWLRRVPGEEWIAALTRDARPFALAVTCVCACAAIFVYRAHPLSMDEFAPMFQARAFAHGNLAGQVPAALVPRLHPPFPFFLEWSDSGRVISGYWPGFALLLTPFVWLGCPWLLNPLIGGASILALWHLARRLWPGTLAPGWAVLLAASSPAFIVNAISFYAMPAHLLASVLYAGLVLEPTPRRLMAAGVLGSFALVLHNPLPHALFALPWIVAVALRPGRWRNLGALGLGYLPISCVLGVGWVLVRSTMGNSTLHQTHGVWSAVDQLLHIAFSPPSAALFWTRTVNLVELTLWAAPVLVPLACLGAWRRRTETGPRLLALSAAATLLGWMFVPFDQGHGWGYRYFHAAWGALPLLAAGALDIGMPAVAALRRLVLAVALGSLIFGNGLRFAQVRTFIDGHLRQIPPSPAPAALEVVFVRPDRGYYPLDLVQNPPFMDGNRWMLISRGPELDARFIRESFRGNSRQVADSGVATVWQIEP